MGGKRREKKVPTDGGYSTIAKTRKRKTEDT